MTVDNAAERAISLVRRGLRRAEEGLSLFLGTPLSIAVDVIAHTSILDVAKLSSAPETAVVDLSELYGRPGRALLAQP